MVFLWFSYGFPMVILWVFLWFSYGLPVLPIFGPHEGGAAASGQCGDFSLRSAGGPLVMFVGLDSPQ